jgi:hypothetical protein
MKVAVIFLLSLFFCLAGGSHFSYATAPACNASFSLSQFLEKKQPVANGTANKHLLAAVYDFNEENQYLDGVEDDNEDEIVRKHILAARYFLACYYTFIEDYFPNNLTGQLFTYKAPSYTGSCKYITQRVLRL